MDKHIEANAELAADLLRHMADNEIDSDYFAVVTDSPNCGREVQSEHKVTDAALMAAGIIDALLAKLEAAEKERDELKEEELEWMSHADIHEHLCHQNNLNVEYRNKIHSLSEKLQAAEARLLVPVNLPGIGGVEPTSAPEFVNYADGWRDGIIACKEAIRAAGYPVEGGE